MLTCSFFVVVESKPNQSRIAIVNNSRFRAARMVYFCVSGVRVWCTTLKCRRETWTQHYMHVIIINDSVHMMILGQLISHCKLFSSQSHWLSSLISHNGAGRGWYGHEKWTQYTTLGTVSIAAAHCDSYRRNVANVSVFSARQHSSNSDRLLVRPFVRLSVTRLYSVKTTQVFLAPRL